MNIVPLGLRCIVVFTSIVLAMPASAWVMRENGPEPVIVQLKESVRKSDSLEAELANLAEVQRHRGVQVERRWAGPKYLERVAFPANFSEEQVLEVVRALEQLSCVEKVVPASAFNLEFRAADFARDYSPHDRIPEAAKRGLDAHRLNRSAPPPPAELELDEPHTPNRLIVSWKPEHVWRGERTGFEARAEKLHASAGCRVVKEFKWSDTELVQIVEFDPDKGPLSARLQRYRASDLVEYAQPDYVQSSFARIEPNDPYFPSQTATLNLIRAPEAWGSGITGSEAWTIAVADSLGTIPEPIPDLSSATGNASGASATFYDSYPTSTSNDDNSVRHGTRVASIIGAQANNGTQMAGVAWNIKLMHLKIAGGYLCFEGEQEAVCYTYDSASSAAAIRHAWDISVRNPPQSLDPAIAINMSFGSVPSPGYNQAQYQALQAAKAGNLLAICAVGPAVGSPTNLDSANSLVSPACIPTDNVIAVGGTNPGDTDRATNSSWGRFQVDLGAPSTNVLSLTGSGAPSAQTGNSFSAPQVAGTVGLIKTKYPWENYLGLRDRVLMGVDEKSLLADDFRTSGRLNAEKALLPRTVIRNLSTRARVEGGERVMIGGFVVGGSMPGYGAAPLKVLIRGLGPSIPVGVAKLGNPKITLRQGSTMIDSNDDWQSHPTAGEVQSIGFQPASTAEAALIITLQPGAYTVVLEDAGTAYGVGLFEMYELAGAANEQSRLLNVSTRCFVGSGDNQAFVGSFVGNSLNLSPAQLPKRRLLVMGNGPRLGLAGVSGYLPNPFLQLANSAGAITMTNDRWEDIDGASIGLQSELSENGWEGPPGAANYRPDEAALWPTFPSGTSFSAILGPAPGTGEGIGVIEFYEY